MPNSKIFVLPTLLILSFPVHATFIESTIGNAVANDATAIYYNPAALTLLKNKQSIASGSIGASRTQFSGQATQLSTGFIQSGVSNSNTNYLLPSMYFGVPVNTNFVAGIAIIANDFTRDIEGHSILRYVQSNNTIEDVDLVPAVGFKLNQLISFGLGLNGSRAHFIQQPISGVPSLNIPDSKSHNESHGDGFGGDIGLLMKPRKGTVLGFNYRQAMTYEMKGKSTLNGQPPVSSDNYHFTYWTPARSVLSMSHLITKKIGLIATVQYVQWSIFTNATIYNVATPAGIVPSAKVPYHFHNSGLVTLGSNYKISPKLIIRAAGTYTQAPSNGKFQIDIGDTLALGGSFGYTLFKNVIIDCSYAHAFIKKQDIQITSAQNSIFGKNQSMVNSFALKLTVNV